MDVILDGNSNFQLEGNPADVLAAVGAVSEYLREQGRAILSIRSDGENVDADKLVDSLHGKSLEEIQTLEIESEDISKLVVSFLQDMGEALPEITKACHDLAAVFHSDAPHEGYEPFHHLADIWGSIKARETVVLHALELDPATFAIGDIVIDKHHEELNKYLTECADALEKNDCVLLGDLLEYELAPRAEREAEIVARLHAESQKRLS